MRLDVSDAVATPAPRCSLAGDACYNLGRILIISLTGSIAATLSPSNVSLTTLYSLYELVGYDIVPVLQY